MHRYLLEPKTNEWQWVSVAFLFDSVGQLAILQQNSGKSIFAKRRCQEFYLLHMIGCV